MTSLNYKQFGDGGTPLIILHGLFGSLDNWQGIAQVLSANYKVIILDQRNHGKSPHFKEHNYSLMAEDLKEFADQLQLSSINLLGHSMGGKTAMQFAIEYPQLVQKLIVADIAPRYYPPHHQSVLKALNAVNFEEVTSRKEVEQILKQQDLEDGVVQFLLKNLTWESKETLCWKFNFKTLERDIENIGEELNGYAYFTHPTLFLKGERSSYIGTDDLDQIEQIFPISTVVEIKNAGHWLHADNSSDFIKEVVRFLG